MHLCTPVSTEAEKQFPLCTPFSCLVRCISSHKKKEDKWHHFSPTREESGVQNPTPRNSIMALFPHLQNYINKPYTTFDNQMLVNSSQGFHKVVQIHVWQLKIPKNLGQCKSSFWGFAGLTPAHRIWKSSFMRVYAPCKIFSIISINTHSCRCEASGINL